MSKDVRPHFDGKDPLVKKIYDRLIEACCTFGPVKVESKQTSIHLVNRSAFAGVHTRNNYLNLEVVLSKSLLSTRVDKIDQVSANRYHHRFKLVSVKDVDKELKSWLREAYKLKK